MKRNLICIAILCMFSVSTVLSQTTDEKKRKEEEELQKKLKKAEEQMKKYEKWMPTVEEMQKEKQKRIEKSMKELTHRDPERRTEAAKSLGDYEYAPAVSALAQALKDKDERVRVEAASALWNIGEASKEASSELNEALKDPSGRVRLYAAGALRMLGEDEQQLIPPLREVLQSVNVWNRAYAIVQLLEMEVPTRELIPAIDSILLDSAHRKPEQYTFDLLSMKFEPVNTDPNTAAKALLLEGLSKYSLPAEIIPALQAAKQDLDSEVRSLAIRCLSNVKQSSSDRVANLRESLKSKNPTDRVTAIYNLKVRESLFTPEVVSDLITATRDKDTAVRAAAAECLGKAKPVTAEIVDTLIVALQDKKADVRKAAAEAFEEIAVPGKKAFPLLQQIATSDKDEWVRFSAKRALYAMGDKSD